MKALIGIALTVVCGMALGEMVVGILVNALNTISEILKVGR